MATPTLEQITPNKAARYLDHNSQNRRVRTKWVDTLARCINEGRFLTTHHGIAFNCDGTLIDGQHRLMAIVKAGKPVKMWVWRGMDRDTLYAIDQGKSRSIEDTAGPVGVGVDIRRDHAAVIKAMHDGFTDIGDRIRMAGTVTNQEWIAKILKHRDAIDFAIDNLKAKPHKHAIIRAVVARAWYTADRERLAEWCRVFVTNVPASPKDSAALVFARFFLPQAAAFSNGPCRRDLYLKCESSVRAFLAGTPMKHIKPVESEQFPIPGEEG